MERFLANTHAVVVTAAEYMNFMRLCEDHGCLWNSGQKPTEFTPTGFDPKRYPNAKYTVYSRKDGSRGMIVASGICTSGYKRLYYEDIGYDDVSVNPVDEQTLMCILSLEES